MIAQARTTTLGAVFAELGDDVRLLSGSEKDVGKPVTGASLVGDSALPDDPGVILVHPGVASVDDLDALARRLGTSPVRLLILAGPSHLDAAEFAGRFRGHVVAETGKPVNPADVVLSIARALDQRDETAMTRRLASLQRSLTQALGEPEPADALLARLKATCNAEAAVVDTRGRAVRATGPIPLVLLFGQLSRTSVQTQMLDIDGWRGIADRVHKPGEDGEFTGWLVMASRRESFPDPYVMSAVHVATALLEAIERLTLVARQQERAIRASLLEEALSLRQTPDDPELAGRIASLGLAFAEGLRAVVVRPARPAVTGRERLSARTVADGLIAALEGQGIAQLTSVRDQVAIMLVQATPSTLRRVLAASKTSVPEVHIGVGRPVRAVGEVADSYHDALLAVQWLSRTAKGAQLMPYENFDFATRLFADVGADRMIAWARDFLTPLDERPQLLEGLSTYFAHSQNMNAAAHALNIHHNSLRYRLAKVEEALGLSMRDPAAVSSLFLALTARDLERQGGPQPRATRTVRTSQPTDVEAPRTPVDFVSRAADRTGVVFDPGR
ncbi:PucR family transcriptional regulator [Amycolatopsis sp. NPDC003865]